MVFVTPTTTEVLQWEGLHLFHFESSTRSKKVRTVLALKELNCTLHHVDLTTHENKTEYFLGINPRGLVPVLVHDGKVVVESNDIIQYLDDAFGPDSSIPTRRLGDANTEQALAAEDALHMAMRTLTFSFRIPSVRPVWKSTSASGAPDNSSLSHFSVMTLSCWLRRAVRNRHRHAIEQASHRWRGGRTHRKILISTQARTSSATPRPASRSR